VIYLESFDSFKESECIFDVRSTSSYNGEPGIKTIHFPDGNTRKLKLISTESEIKRLESKLNFLKEKGYNRIHVPDSKEDITFRDFDMTTLETIDQRNAISITPFEDEWYYVDVFRAESKMANDNKHGKFLIDQEHNLIKFLKSLPDA
jgi:hypothetical protein